MRSSILTGVVQLLALVLSPLVGLVSSSIRLSASHPQALALAVAFAFGAASFVGFALLPGGGDPRAGVSWLYVVGLGVAQAAGVVLSLALVTTGRGTVVAKEGREVAGALSGAYGLSGGASALSPSSCFVPLAQRAVLTRGVHARRTRHPRRRLGRGLPLRPPARRTLPRRRRRRRARRGRSARALAASRRRRDLVAV